MEATLTRWGATRARLAAHFIALTAECGDLLVEMMELSTDKRDIARKAAIVNRLAEIDETSGERDPGLPR